MYIASSNAHLVHPSFAHHYVSAAAPVTHYDTEERFVPVSRTSNAVVERRELAADGCVTRIDRSVEPRIETEWVRETRVRPHTELVSACF
jgi:hypothetical protein